MRWQPPYDIDEICPLVSEGTPKPSCLHYLLLRQSRGNFGLTLGRCYLLLSYYFADATAVVSVVLVAVESIGAASSVYKLP